MLATIVRFILSALVLLFVSLLVPGFRVGGFFGALIAALVIAVLGQAARAIFGPKASPQGRGLVSFLVSAVIIYLTQFIAPGVRVNLIGALLAALVIGIVDAFIPTELR